MAKPKITRLGDPANPYTKVKVTAEQARASAAKQPKRTKVQVVNPPVRKPVGDPPTGPLGRARKSAMDRAIKAAGG